MKTYKELLESININEKSAEFLRLNFKDTKTVEKVAKWVYKNIWRAVRGDQKCHKPPRQGHSEIGGFFKKQHPLVSAEQI